MSLNLKRKPRNKPAAYTRPAKKQKITNDTPHTSAQLPNKCSNSRQNLTLADWLSVYAFVDAHPRATQADIVRHFKSRPTGGLNFDQSTLSRKLRLGERPNMEARINDNPNALSVKRPRVVTRPDVERALVLWVQHMEHKGETVTSHMLHEKRKRFDDEFDVPEKERLLGECHDHSKIEGRRQGTLSREVLKT